MKTRKKKEKKGSILTFVRISGFSSLLHSLYCHLLSAAVHLHSNYKVGYKVL